MLAFDVIIFKYKIEIRGIMFYLDLENSLAVI